MIRTWRVDVGLTQWQGNVNTFSLYTKFSKCLTSVIPNWPTITILAVAVSGLLSPPLFTACTDTVYTVNSCRLLRVIDEAPAAVVTCFVSGRICTLMQLHETAYVGDRSASAAGSHFTSREAPSRMTRQRLVGAAIKWIVVEYLRVRHACTD